jgi:thiol-disulfide isomerase/thioredoxin
MTTVSYRSALRKLRTRLLSSLAVASVCLLATEQVQAAPNPAFSAALAELRRGWEEAAVVGTTLEREAQARATFFSRIPVESLGPREIAELARLNAFRYGEVAHASAKIATVQLKPLVTVPDLDGALAATLRVLLSGYAGIKGDERAEAVVTALHHPAYVALLHSDYGDLALDTACRAGMRNDNYREFVVGVAAKLDATQSTAAADSVGTYWGKIEQAIPEGEQRQRLRQQLVGYLAGVLARDSDALTAERRAKIETLLARLNSIAARGETLLGKPAPDLHFLWSSEGNWKSLSELRGKVIVLDFWATWCGACIESFPKVTRLAERYRDADVIVVGVTSLQGAVMGLGKTIDCRGDPDKEMRLMNDYIKAKKISWPVVFSREKVINPDYGISGIPHLVIVAPDGTVRYQVSGLADETPLTEKIEALLREFKLRPALSMH